MGILDDAFIEQVFSEQGVDCYAVKGRKYLNKYYIVSEAGTRKLLNTPEIIGYDVYRCMLKPTSQMLYHFKNEGRIHSANILTILRGALNYPLEESCYNEHIRVHDISFLSSERIFSEKEKITGLAIKYSKLAVVDGGTLLMGDIIASGETLVHCLNYVIENYRERNARLRNSIIFTIGGTKAVEILEKMTAEIRACWPSFEGFIAVFYEGVFSTYQDHGITGINVPDVDFYWKNGIISPQFHRETLSLREPLFEKCIIYDGGARRYAIHEHIAEVLDYWKYIYSHSDSIEFQKLLEEKLGHEIPVSYQQWLTINHYEHLPEEQAKWLYEQEIGFAKGLKAASLKEIAEERISSFSKALRKYMDADHS